MARIDVALHEGEASSAVQYDFRRCALNLSHTVQRKGHSGAQTCLLAKFGSVRANPCRAPNFIGCTELREQLSLRVCKAVGQIVEPVAKPDPKGFPVVFRGRPCSARPRWVWTCSS